MLVMWNDLVSQQKTELWKRVGLTVFLLSLATGVIESLAGTGGRNRLIDFTGIVLEYPIYLTLFASWLVFVLWRMKLGTVEELIERILTLAPIALLLPITNALVAWVGLEPSVPKFLNIAEVPVSLLTLGWWPRFLATPGTLVVIVLIGAWLGAMLYRLRMTAPRVIFGVLFWMAGAFGLLLVPSLISWIVVSTNASPLTAGPNVLARSWVALSQEGYWWRSTVGRFPGVLEGEAEASVRLLQLASAWLLGLFGVASYLYRSSKRSVQELFSWFKGVRGISFSMAALFGVWIGSLSGGAFFVRGIDIVAIGLFILVLKAVWGLTTIRNDLEDFSSDVEAGRVDRPLVAGTRTYADLQTMAMMLALVAIVGGWFLGWPVFLPLGLFLVLQETLVYPGLRLKTERIAPVILGLSQVSVFIAGVFFALRTASVPVLRPGIWLAVMAFYLLHSLPKAIRWNNVLWEAWTKRVNLPSRFVIPLALALGYLLLPLLSGWTVLWWISLPCAAVALLPLLGSGRWDDRKIVGWQTAFLLISCLLLTVRP